MDTNENISRRLKEIVDANYKSQRAFAEALSVVAGKQIKEQNVSDYLNGSARPGFIWQERLEKLGHDSDWIMTGRPPVDQQPQIMRGRLLMDVTLPTDVAAIDIQQDRIEGGVRVRVFEAIKEIKKIQPMLEDEGVIVLRTPRAAEGNVPYSGKAAATPLTNED